VVPHTLIPSYHQMTVDPFLGTRAQRLFIATISIQAIAVLAIISVVFHSVRSCTMLSHI
jgi:hypothetical protein